MLKCRLDTAYLDCSIVCGGGIHENVVKTALGVLLKKSKSITTFKAFLAAFENSVDKMMNRSAWKEEWVYPPIPDDDDDDEDRIDDYFQDEEILESYFHAFEKPDLGSWCFGK